MDTIGAHGLQGPIQKQQQQQQQQEQQQQQQQYAFS
jgi:hypothetical protein